MVEYNEETKRPNLYEQFAPELRFAMIASAILKKTGESPDEDEAKSVVATTWPKKPEGYWYKLQLNVVNTVWQIPTYYFSLEHHLSGMPADKPMTRYNVSTGLDNSMSAISILNAEGKAKKLDPEGRREAIAELLSILADAAPEESKRVLADTFHHRYENLVGAYVLSSLAIAGQQDDMSELNAVAQADLFEEQTNAIEQKVLSRSERRDSPVKQSFIEEAVTTRRSKTNMNEYRDINVSNVTKRVAKEILFRDGKRWKYTVGPEQ